jgi:MarR family transcriptional regulator for hemolysin
LTPKPSIEDDILEHFQSLMQHASVLHAPEFLGVDLTMSQAKVLYVVSLRPDSSMSELAAQLGIGLPAASGLVDRLVTGGYVERHEDPADRRSQRLNVTTDGAAALDQMRELRIGLMRRLLTRLTPPELRAVSSAITALDREATRLDDTDPATPARFERTPA